MRKSTKDLLAETFGSIPNKFSYREVRFHVYQALKKLQDIEKREGIRAAQEQERQIKEEEKKKVSPWMPPIYQEQYNVKATLDMIDKMIAEEYKKLEDIHNRKKDQGVIKPSEPTDDDDDDLQTIHG